MNPPSTSAGAGKENRTVRSPLFWGSSFWVLRCRPQIRGFWQSAFAPSNQNAKMHSTRNWWSWWPTPPDIENSQPALWCRRLKEANPKLGRLCMTMSTIIYFCEHFRPAQNRRFWISILGQSERPLSSATSFRCETCYYEPIAMVNHLRNESGKPNKTQLTRVFKLYLQTRDEIRHASPQMGLMIPSHNSMGWCDRIYLLTINLAMKQFSVGTSPTNREVSIARVGFWWNPIP